MKNYYLILGVESDATMEQIRAAYLRQAKDLHPDYYYGQDIGPFIDLQEAYAMLSDPARRRAYDDVLHQRSYAEPSRPGSAGTEPLFSSKPAPEPLIPTQEQADLGELSLTRSFGSFSPSFDELFDRLNNIRYAFRIARSICEQYAVRFEIKNVLEMSSDRD